MYRIVFFYCTCTTLLLGTLVYSKPYENGHPQIGHENQMIFSVPSDEHAIVEEEPVILNISTEVAKFILYFIKKYCKNNEKIGFLENMLKTKQLTNIEPSLAYFESSSPLKTESTKPKQGHSINYNYKYKLATVPNYELKTPTIKTETKHKELHRMELTTSNIPFTKTIQYQTPKFKFFEEPSKVSFKETTLPATTIEGPLIAKNNYEYSTHEHEKPKVFEPMYEYASHGDEYDYPDYDYPSHHVEQKVSMSPKFGETEPQTDTWYKYFTSQKPQSQTKVHVNTYANEYEGPKQTKVENSSPGILDGLYKYINSLSGEHPMGHQQTTTKMVNEQTPIKMVYEQTPIKMVNEQTPMVNEQTPMVNEHNFDLNQKKPGILQKIYKYFVPEEKEFDGPDMNVRHEKIGQPGGFEYAYNYKKPNTEQPKYSYSFGPEEKQEFDGPDINVRHEKIGQPGGFEYSYNYKKPNTEQPKYSYSFGPEEKQEFDGPDMNVRHEKMGQPGGFEYTYNYKKPNTEQPKYTYSWYQQQNKGQPDAYFTKQDSSFQKNEQPQVHFIKQEGGPQEFSMRQQTGPQVYFSHEPHLQQHVFEFDKPKYAPDSSEVIFKYNKEPQIQEHTFGYSIPTPQSDNWYTVYEQQKMEPQIIRGEHFTKPAQPSGTWKKSFHYTDPEDVKQFADSIYSYYKSILDDFKIYSKELNNLEFTKNTNKIDDILSGWKLGGKFYDGATMNNATTMMDKLMQANMDLETKPPPVTETTTEITGNRRNFDVPLSEYLEDPEEKEDFGSLDLILQNVILAYLELKKEKQTPQIEDTKLFLLRKIKYIMRKYNNLFDRLNWVDDEIKNLSKNDEGVEQDVADIFNKVLFNDLELMKHLNGMNFNINSKIFLTLLNIPITAQSKEALNDLLQNFLKGISKLSERDAEFKDVKFYIGEQKDIEQTPFFKRLMQFVLSPGDFLKMQEQQMSVQVPENRRSFTEVEETKTEMPLEPTELETTTQQPTSTTPKKQIEKHHNIFREFLMDSDE